MAITFRVAENQHLVPDDAALVVDVGGSYGDVLQMILKAFPGIPAGRVVLQDRISVIEEAEKLDTPALRGVRKMAHDFFTPQPLKGTSNSLHRMSLLIAAQAHWCTTSGESCTIGLTIDAEIF